MNCHCLACGYTIFTVSTLIRGHTMNSFVMLKKKKKKIFRNKIDTTVLFVKVTDLNSNLLA